MLFELKSISVHYKNKMPALHNINLMIDSGSRNIIIGPTGAGKTTFINLLRNEVEPTYGDIYFKGINYKKLKGKKLRLFRQISGFIEQHPKMINELNVFENILIPLIFNGYKKDKAIKKVLELLATLNISYLRTKYPGELSIGETKLVATARALISEPEIIIADEPTENLDDVSKILVLDLLAKSSQNNNTLILTTHDPVIKNSFKRANSIYLNEGKIID